MTDRASGNIVLALAGHVGLVLAIVADFYRRSSEGVVAVLLSIAGMVALIIGGTLFVRHPRLFFFGAEGNETPPTSPSLFWRVFTWVFVIGAPILWLIGMPWLLSGIPSELGGRLAGGYMFFAWIATAIILSPNLFVRYR